MKIVILLAMFASIFTQTEFQKGLSYLDSKEYQNAKAFFEDIVDDDDENLDAWYYLAQSQFYLKEYEDAVESLEEIINDDTKNIDYLKLYAKANQEYVHEASVFSKMGIASDLQKTYRRLVELDPNDLESERNLIGFLMNAPGIAGGDTKEGLQRIEKLKTKDLVLANVFLFRHHLNNENFSQARSSLEIIEKSTEISKYYNLYNTLGYKLLEQGKNQDALSAFLKQAELNPNDANCFDSLGDGYKAIGNKAKAIESYKKALSLNPNFESSRKNLKELGVTL
jgi:tetratricopeptide (TPR) repeat protein